MSDSFVDDLESGVSDVASKASIAAANAGGGIGQVASTIKTGVEGGVAAAATGAAIGGAASLMGLGAAIGSAIPLPGVGTAIGFIVGAMAAIAKAIGGVHGILADSTSPDEAKAMLAIFELDPALMFTEFMPESHIGFRTWDPGEAVDVIKRLRELAHDTTRDQMDSLQYWTSVQTAVKQQSEKSDVRRERIYVPPAVTAGAAAAFLSVLRKNPDAAKAAFDYTKEGHGDEASMDVQWRTAIKAVRQVAGETGSDPVLSKIYGDVTVKPAKTASTLSTAMHDSSNWWLGGGAFFGTLALGIGLIKALKPKKRVALNHFTAQADPGRRAFDKVLARGVLDHELDYLRSGMRPMLYFHKAFSDARRLGITPTELATSGRYFGPEVLPIRIEVMPDGKLHLSDGRHRYTAAKAAGARAILANVVLYDDDGYVARERTLPIKLL